MQSLSWQALPRPTLPPRPWPPDRRCLPLTVRSFAMGALLQLPLAPVVAVRDAFVSQRFSPAHFLDHAAFDCGTL